MTKRSAREKILFEAVDKFYDNEVNFVELCKMLSKSSNKVLRRSKIKKQNKPATRKPKLNLRLVDYAVSTYSLNGALVTIETKGGAKQIKSVQSIFRAGLSCYGRSNYDVYRRTNTFQYTKFGRTVAATLGQLVFFRDVIRYNILKWIRDNLSDIQARMYAEFPNEPKRARSNTAVSKCTAAVSKLDCEVAMG